MNRRLFNLLIVMFLSFFLITNVYADDYSDDIYDGDYSIEDMLQNYSVVTFGQKAYDEHVTMLRNTAPGSLQIFHIVGNFIVKGGIKLIYNSDRNNEYGRLFADSSNSLLGEPDYRADCKSIDSNKMSRFTYFAGDRFVRAFPCRDKVYSSVPYFDYYNSLVTFSGNYINIERLYAKIIEEQNKIKKGRYVEVENGVANIEIGGEYYINNINDIDSIVFDKFENNENQLTIITINDSGNINFPEIYDGSISESNIIPTNDFFQSTKPNNSYPGNYVLSKYKGNIIWNIPNATYISLPTTPFVGHLIAPNADVEGGEFHFAGAFLVNSLAVEGNTEAHFYPLIITNIPYRSNLEPVKAKTIVPPQQGRVIFNNNVNLEELEEGMVVSFSIEPEDNYVLKNIEIKDEEDNSVPYTEIKTLEYEFTMPKTNVTITPTFQQRNIKDIITNPKTGNILLFIVFMISLIIGISLFKKKESTKI